MYSFEICILYFLVFILGASIASFICLAAERGGIRGRSACSECKKKLQWYELLPIFSFLIQGGKCRTCKGKIPNYLLLSEIGLGLWFLFTVYSGYNLTLLLLQLILGSVFLYLAVEDSRDMQICSKYLYIFVSICLAGVVVNFLSTNNYSNVLVPILIFSIFWILYFLDRGYIGEADPYIFTGLGLFFGTQFSVSLLLYSVWFGSIYGIFYLYFINKKFERGVRIPFLPIIFTATLFIIIFNFHIIKIQDILFLYENL